MTAKAILRCAIYTRKSSEEGLDQDFNSLQAQREACEAYITSQKHEGWQIVKTAYDDGGFSGGTMERPALKQLLADITAGRIDVIVVYKVDRLSRSLHDFARMVEVFDKHGVSFVSVTQQFNTTTSMGRLTLNVLLSFAQFEREVTGERIRDKIAASKKKGMWMGGFVPLGYDLKERKLLVNAKEVERVQYIYRRYLELGCVRLLKEDLDGRGIRSKARGQKDGCLLARGLLYKILSNPMYIGQIRHKGICHPGQHEAIIAQELWDEVQQRIAENRVGEKGKLRKTELSPLAGKLFDASGERLIPVHARKQGRRYRYYVSQSLATGTKETSVSGWRLPGQEIEQVIAHATSELLHDNAIISTALQRSGLATHYIPAALRAAEKIQPGSPNLMDSFIQRIELRQEGIRLTLSLAPLATSGTETATITHDIPMQMKRRGVEMRLIIGNAGPAKIDQTLLRMVIRAHKWFNELLSGRAGSMTEIGAREGVDRSYIAKMISMAFLAPDIVESIIAGRQPTDLTVEKLSKHIDIPWDWSQQRRMLVI